MIYLVTGLVLFLGIHSVRIVAEPWRTHRIAQMGAGTWKGVYSLLSIVSFILIVYGYGLSRQAPIDLWMPPVWTRHLAALLTLPVFVLLVAAYVPGSHIKAVFKHPMTLAIKLWAGAHLLSNGRLGDVLLFGGFLLWSAFLFRAARQRDRQQSITYVAIGWSRDVIAIVAGLLLWGVFATYLHGVLIGVRPFG